MPRQPKFFEKAKDNWGACFYLAEEFAQVSYFSLALEKVSLDERAVLAKWKKDRIERHALV